MHGNARLTEHRPMLTEPKIPLQNHRHISVVARPVDAKTKAHAVVDAGDEAIVRERDRPAKTPTKDWIGRERSEQRVRLELERMVRVPLGLANDVALSVRRSTNQQQRHSRSHCQTSNSVSHARFEAKGVPGAPNT